MFGSSRGESCGLSPNIEFLPCVSFDQAWIINVVHNGDSSYSKEGSKSAPFPLPKIARDHTPRPKCMTPSGETDSQVATSKTAKKKYAFLKPSVPECRSPRGIFAGGHKAGVPILDVAAPSP